LPAFAKPVSIEIAARSVRVAQLLESRGRVRAIRFAECPLPADYRWEVGADRGPLAEAIRRAMAQAGIRTRTAIIALPRRQVTSRVGAFPQAERAELERVVGYDLADHIPFPVDQVVIDFQPLGASREEPGLTDVLVVAAQRDLVREYLSLAEDLGLRPAALTVDALALDDLTTLAEREPAGTTVMVAIEARTTTINVSEQGRLRLTRSIGLGGHQLSLAIQDDLGVTFDDAERHKKADGLLLLEKEPRPRRVSGWLDSLLGDIRRSALSFGPAAVSAVLLTGSEAEVPGLREALRAELRVDPVGLSVAQLFPGAELAGESEEVADRCVVAIAQALRAVGRSAWTVSLLPREVVAARRARRVRQIGGAVAVLAIAGMAVGYVMAARGLAQTEKKVRELEAQEETAVVQRAYVAGLQAQQEQLETQVRVLESARLKRYVGLELLRTIAFYAPEDIVLSHFTLRPDQSLEVRGAASSSATAADLQQTLATSPFIADARLVGISRPSRQSGADQAVTFTMRLGLRGRQEASPGAEAFRDRGGPT